MKNLLSPKIFRQINYFSKTHSILVSFIIMICNQKFFSYQMYSHYQNFSSMECRVASRWFRDVCPEIFAFFRDINVKHTKYHENGLSNWENRGFNTEIAFQWILPCTRISSIPLMHLFSPKKLKNFILVHPSVLPTLHKNCQILNYFWKDFKNCK